MRIIREMWGSINPTTQGWIFVMLYVCMISIVVMS